MFYAMWKSQQWRYMYLWLDWGTFATGILFSREEILCSIYLPVYFYRDTDTSKNTWSVLKALNLADVATEGDVAIVRETCAVVSERGAKIVAAGK